MQINILSIGSFSSNDLYVGLFNEYKKRIPWQVNLIEIKSRDNKNDLVQKDLEAKLFEKHLNKEHKLIVLDERGKTISNFELVEKFQDLEYNRGLDFIIGGYKGLHESIIKRADFVLSFGKLVFPHLLIRVMLIEQIYRTYSIMNNHPYHK